MEDKEEIFVKCECQGEAIEITYWPEDKEFYLAFWDIGRSKVSWLPWRKRLQIIWRVIRGKDLYSDMVILDHERAKTVVDFINKNLKEVENGV